MKIETQQQLDVRNLISFRKSVRATEIQGHIERLIAYTESQGAKKVDGGISATYAVDGDKMDIEIYMPIDKEISSTHEFIYKPRLYLENCIKTTHKGNPQLLDGTIQKMNEHIALNRLTPISAGFNVTVSEISNPKELDLFEATIYISLNPNVV